jgi:hypothetical protein
MLVAEKGDCLRINLKELIGADPALVSDLAIKTQKTALHIAAKRGFLDVVSALVDRKADKDVIDKYGKTPLHYAAVNQRHDVVRFLLDANADSSIEANGKTPLDLLIMESQTEDDVKHDSSRRRAPAAADTRSIGGAFIKPGQRARVCGPSLRPARIELAPPERRAHRARAELRRSRTVPLRRTQRRDTARRS